MDKYFEKTLQLADAATKRFAPEGLKWMWGEALLMHSLGILNDLLGDDRYTDYIKRYADHHIEKGLRVDQSDTLAPTLATYYLQKKLCDEKYKEITDRGIDYIKNSEKIINNMPNHLGSSPEGKMYPRSIWVDSIMMYGVFSALYAKENDIDWLMDFAKTQPKFFSDFLQDKETKLFVHSYWVKQGKKYPDNLFWGRGNGWVVAAMPMLLDNLPEGPEKERAKNILVEISESLLKYQREDGYFELILNKPGKTKKESSATALIASGWMHGVRKGYLDSKFLQPAKKSFYAVVDDLQVYKDGMLSMDYISGPTIPVQIFPYAGYRIQRLVFKEIDWSYGLAALFFAAANYEMLNK
ncbi:MAG: glycoside hydrolase family 88 protein [Clostridia bacterium]|nr:glycoside hydrolase family 88 protein [Clostridia bacterium]